jgi:pyruvate formate lyase activating enzyme
MTQLTGTIFDIKKYAIHDGPGIRTTVFFQGCPLTCRWCHNPESQSRWPVLLYRASRCVLCGTCVEACPQQGIELSPSGAMGQGMIATTDRTKCDVCGQCAEICYHGAREVSGQEISVVELMAEIERDVPFYDQSGGGVTFSGGEPLLQPPFLKALLQECKKRGIHTVVDTSGYTTWDVLDGLRGDVDLFLYDLKMIDSDRHKSYTGVSNQLILNNLQRLAACGTQIEIRVPLIPGVNDDAESLNKAAAFITRLPNIARIELMTYHDIAASKYQFLGLDYPFDDLKPPSKTGAQEAARIFEAIGFGVKVS